MNSSLVWKEQKGALSRFDCSESILRVKFNVLFFLSFNLLSHSRVFPLTYLPFFICSSFVCFSSKFFEIQKCSQWFYFMKWQLILLLHVSSCWFSSWTKCCFFIGLFHVSYFPLSDNNVSSNLFPSHSVYLLVYWSHQCCGLGISAILNFWCSIFF